MAIYLRDKDGNRKLVAGSGAAGKGAYEAAVAGGYTGTEDEFNAMMANIATKAYVDSLVGDIKALLDELNGEVV